MILARDVSPPRSIGLFGDWGVGKSFFIKEMMARVDALTRASAEAEARRGEAGFEREPAFWSDVAQIRFNAWHYMDANLWASLVASIFDGLAEHLRRRGGRKDEIEHERAHLMDQLELAREEVRELEGRRRAAESDRDRLQAELAEIAHLSDKEKAGRGDLDEANARLGSIKQQLADLKVGRRLCRFIQERVERGEYKDRLGIVALVRRASPPCWRTLRGPSSKGPVQIDARAGAERQKGR